MAAALGIGLAAASNRAAPGEKRYYLEDGSVVMSLNSRFKVNVLFDNCTDGPIDAFWCATSRSSRAQQLFAQAASTSEIRPLEPHGHYLYGCVHHAGGAAGSTLTATRYHTGA